jgi:ATP-binding cassette subfamily C (CFTR/MRP) protein 1
LVAVEAAYVGVWANSPAHYRTATSIAAASLSLSVAACIFALAWAQHRHSLRLSSLLSIYLAITILIDASQIRSLSKRPGLHAEASCLIVATALKGCLLLLEEVPKRHLFHRKADDAASSRESSSGFWNRRLFVWINTTLLGGFRSILVVDNLQHLGSDFDSGALLRHLEERWESGETPL